MYTPEQHAEALRVFREAYMFARSGSPRRAGATFAAVSAVLDYAATLRQAHAQGGVTEQAIAGALFDLMGFLTTRDEVTILSAVHDAAPAVQALEAFAAKRGIALDEANVASWSAALSAQQQGQGGARSGPEEIAIIAACEAYHERMNDVHHSEDLVEVMEDAQNMAFIAYRDSKGDDTAPPAQPAERVPEEVRKALEVAQGDLHMLKRAIEARDPWSELLLRATDTERDLRSLLAASPAPSPARGDGGECRHKWVATLGPDNGAQRCDHCGDTRP